MAWIRTVDPRDATGMLRQLYEEAIRRAGRIWNIVRLMSLKPETLKASIDLYVQLMHRPSPLSRATREMLAVVVSKANHCHY